MTIRKLEVIAVLDRSDLTAQELEIRQTLDDLAAFFRAHADFLAVGRQYGFEIGLSQSLFDALYLMQGDQENGTKGLANTLRTTPHTNPINLKF